MRAVLIGRNSLWIALDTAISFAGSLITSVAVARVMGPEKLGHYVYILWVVSVTGLVGTIAMAAAVRKYAAEFVGRGDMDTAAAIVRFALRWQGAAAGVVTACAVALMLATVQPFERAYSLVAVASIFPYMMLAVPAGAIEATQRFAANVWPSILANLVSLGGMVLTLALGWDLIGLTSALLASRSLDFVLRYAAYRRLFPPAQFAAGTMPDELRRRITRFGVQATGLMALNVVVWDRSEVLFLKLFSDARQLAYFSLSFNIVQQILTLPQIFASAAGTNLLVEQGRDPSGLGPLVGNVVRYVALIAFPLTLGIAALSSPAIQLLYGPAYAPAIQVLALVAIFSVPRAFLTPAQHLLAATENQGFLLAWGLVTAALNVALDLWLIPSRGAIGAAWANGAAQTVAIAGIWVFIARRLSVRPPAAALMRMLLSAVSMAAMAAVLARMVPPLLAGVLGTLAGGVVYGALLRWGGALDQADQRRLLGIRDSLPDWMRPGYATLVKSLAR